MRQAEFTVLRILTYFLFFQRFFAEAATRFYPAIQLDHPYDGFEFTHTEPAHSLRFLRLANEDPNQLDNLLIAEKDYFAEENLAATVMLRYGRPSNQTGAIIPFEQAGDETWTGNFGALYGFCWLVDFLSNADVPDLVYVQRSTTGESHYVGNLRFADFSPTEESLRIRVNAPLTACPLAVGDLNEDGAPDLIFATDLGEEDTALQLVSGPFANQASDILVDVVSGGTGIPEAMRSVKFSHWNLPTKLPYPIRYAALPEGRGALMVSAYIAKMNNQLSSAGEVRVLMSDSKYTGEGLDSFFDFGLNSNEGWDKIIRCGEDNNFVQYCGLALTTGFIVPDTLGVVLGWLDPISLEYHLGVIYDLASLLENPSPIVITDYLDLHIVAESNKISVPVSPALDIVHIRGFTEPAEIVLRMPDNPISVFVFFPDQLTPDAAGHFSVSQLNGFNGFTIQARKHFLPARAPFIESMGESAAFPRLSSLDCQDIVLSNKIPTSHIAAVGEHALTTAAYVLYCQNLGVIASQSSSASLSVSGTPSASTSPNLENKPSKEEISLAILLSAILGGSALVLAGSTLVLWRCAQPTQKRPLTGRRQGNGILFFPAAQNNAPVVRPTSSEHAL